MRAGGVKNRSLPMPPLLGNGDAVDLLKLFIHVKKRGGHDTITRDGLWEDVGEEQGLQCLGLGSAIKLIYYKYFLMSEKDLGSEGEPYYVDLTSDESDLTRVASENLKERQNNGEGSEGGSTDGGKLFGGKNDMDSDEVEVIEIDSSDSSDNEIDSVTRDVSETENVNDIVKAAETSSNVEMFSEAGTGEKDEKMDEDMTATKEEGSIAKRKRECAVSKMLSWLDSVAKNPTNPRIGTLPESTRWKSYGTEHCWKQVLLTRDNLFRKKPHDSSPELFSSQKKQKMHPSMFDDAGDSAEKIRSSPRLHLLGSLGTSVNHISSLSSFNFSKRIPVGPCFQAQVPEWTGARAESESKWLGTRIWPPNDQSLVCALDDDLAQNPTNHGTREFIGSIECIKTHVSKRRMKLKAELGSAYKEQKFDTMGEEVAASWTKKEEKKFIDVVRENPWSQRKRFWNELSKTFPTKTKEELVNYYFNVFVLRRRAQQNRRSRSNNVIDSDDDETEFVSKSSATNKRSL